MLQLRRNISKQPNIETRPNIDDLMLHHLMCILRCGGHSVALVLKAYVNEFHIEERLQVSSQNHNNYKYDICPTKWEYLDRTMDNIPVEAKPEFFIDAIVIKLVSNLLVAI